MLFHFEIQIDQPNCLFAQLNEKHLQIPSGFHLPAATWQLELLFRSHIYG